MKKAQSTRKVKPRAINDKLAKSVKRPAANDPLTQLRDWFAGNGRTLEGAPVPLIESARSHLATRIEHLSRLGSRRAAVQRQFLMRWQGQLSRQ